METLMQIGIVFVFALAGLLAAIRLKMPPVIGIIVMGALIGPNLFGLVNRSSALDLFSDMGAVMLLFIIGIEFSLSKIMRFGMRALLFAIVKLSFVFAVMYALTALLGFTPAQSIIVGLLFSFSSTTLFSKLTENYKRDYKNEIPLLFALLILEDIIAVMALAVMPSVAAAGSAMYFESILVTLLKSMAMLLLFYVIFRLAVRNMLEYAAFQNTEVLLFTTLSVCAIFVFMATLLGFEASIGAFLAGSMMASMRQFDRIEKLMLPFGLFFSSFFFLSIGMMVDLSSLTPIMLIIIALFLAVSVLAKFVSVGFFSYFFGSGMQASVFSAVSLITASEFSLIIARKMGALVGFDIMTVMTVSLFLSALASAIMMKKVPAITRRIESGISFRAKSRVKSVSTYLGVVTREFEPRGAFYGLFMDGMKRIAAYTAMLAIANGLIAVLSDYIGLLAYAPVPGMGDITLRVILHVAVSALLIFKVIESLNRIVDGFLCTFYRIDRKNFEMDRRIVYAGVGAVMLMLLSVLVPFLFNAVSMSAVTGILQIGAVLLSLVLVVEIITTAHRMVEGGIARKISYSRRRQKSFILDMVGLQRI
jgi:Kef-type K+ transport system membrane component KefB